MNERIERRRGFAPGWKMTLFAVAALPACIALGFWQLERADQKRRLEAAQLDRLAAMPTIPGPALVDFQRLRLSGRFEPRRSFLVDNQTRRGEVGYAVVTSFRADDGRRWLVNRGFVAGDRGRRRMPVFETPTEPVTIVGVVWPELGLMPMLGPDDWAEGWPKRIQRLDVERMAPLLDGAVRAEIRLEPGQPGVLVPPRLVLNMPHQKHTGYAAQWFGLALVLTVGYVIFGIKRHGG